MNFNMSSKNWLELVKNEKLNYNVYIRLCECNSKKSDIIPLTLGLLEYNKDKNIRDAIEYMLEWVLDWNGCNFDYTTEDFEKWYRKIKKTIDN